MYMYRYTSSREVTDGREIQYGFAHPDSRRRSNSPGHLSPSNNGVIQVGNDGLHVVLVQDYDDEVLDIIGQVSRAASVGAPGMEMLLSGLSEIGGEDDGTKILTGGLAFQSLEDMRVAFGIRGASRVLTHQLVRTRAAAFKQQSQRDCDYGSMPEFRMPESVWADPKLREKWMRAILVSHQAYSAAVAADIPYEDARYILPEGTTSFILCEYSLRTFLEMYAYRGCIMFQSEMVYVQRAMRQLLVERHPYLDEHIRISCERVHKCTFQGPEVTANTCDFPWARKTEDLLPLSEAKR